MSYNSIYVHIPFCQQRCNYCDFVSFAGAEREAFISSYPQLIIKELEMMAKGEDAQAKINSIYFGGGTPVVLPSAALCEILAAIRTHFTVAEDAEITVEANPGLLDEYDLQELRNGGFNRLSLGGQSFDDAELAAMGRIHSAAEIVAAVEMARAAGFDNIGVDLIYGLPGQTRHGWYENMQKASELPVQHISLYGLQLDNDSVWGKLYAQGALEAPEEDEQAEFFAMAIDGLPELGFKQYEIANFCRADEHRNWQSRHNSAYWQRRDYLGLGLGAASCCGSKRWVNVGTLAEYAESLNKGELPPREYEELTAEQVISERIFLGLRMLEGIDLPKFKAEHGFDIEERFKESIKMLTLSGLTEYEPGRYLRLARRGIPLANQVFMEFLL